MSWCFSGAGCGNRTHDLMITRLTQSVRPVSSGVVACRLSWDYAIFHVTLCHLMSVRYKRFVDTPWTRSRRKKLGSGIQSPLPVELNGRTSRIDRRRETIEPASLTEQHSERQSPVPPRSEMHPPHDRIVGDPRRRPERESDLEDRDRTEGRPETERYLVERAVDSSGAACCQVTRSGSSIGRTMYSSEGPGEPGGDQGETGPTVDPYVVSTMSSPTSMRSVTFGLG